MIGVVSGSGLDLRELLSCETGEFLFSAELGFEIEALEGHDRRFVRGMCGDHEVMIQCGRLHFYEGYTFEEVVSTVDVLRAFGARAVYFTNVAGGLRPDMSVGDIVSIGEIRTWPFAGWKDRPECVKPDFHVPGCDRPGVYYWMHGPSYETRAEIRALQALGGDVVGMSTAPEVARCNQLGLRCAVVSVVTNNCCAPQVLTHDDVVRAAKLASRRLVGILREAIETMGKLD